MGVAPAEVRKITAPPAARALSTLTRVDYEDAFLLEAGSGPDRTGEQWARAVLEDAPAGTRHALRAGWNALGLKLGSTRDEQLVLGWEIERRSPDFVLLAARSPLGLRGELLFKREQNALLFATFLQFGNPGTRAAWAGIAPGHRRVVRWLLDQAGG